MDVLRYGIAADGYLPVKSFWTGVISVRATQRLLPEHYVRCWSPWDLTVRSVRKCLARQYLANQAPQNGGAVSIIRLSLFVCKLVSGKVATDELAFERIVKLRGNTCSRFCRVSPGVRHSVCRRGIVYGDPFVKSAVSKKDKLQPFAASPYSVAQTLKHSIRSALTSRGPWSIGNCDHWHSTAL